MYEHTYNPTHTYTDTQKLRQGIAPKEIGNRVPEWMGIYDIFSLYFLLSRFSME